MSPGARRGPNARTSAFPRQSHHRRQPAETCLAGGPGELTASWRLDGAVLEEGKEDAVRIWVAEQEQAGLDVLTDGEQRRQHYIWGFYQGLDGIDTVNLGHARPARPALSQGDRCRPPGR